MQHWGLREIFPVVMPRIPRLLAEFPKPRFPKLTTNYVQNENFVQYLYFWITKTWNSATVGNF